MSNEKEINDVYEDRNLLAIALAQETECESGWKPDQESPDEWAIVWIETSHGQVSWHVPRNSIPNNLSQETVTYDGYDRDEKNERMETWVNNNE